MPCELCHVKFVCEVFSVMGTLYSVQCTQVSLIDYAGTMQCKRRVPREKKMDETLIL